MLHKAVSALFFPFLPVLPFQSLDLKEEALLSLQLQDHQHCQGKLVCSSGLYFSSLDILIRLAKCQA